MDGLSMYETSFLKHVSQERKFFLLIFSIYMFISNHIEAQNIKDKKKYILELRHKDNKNKNNVICSFFLFNLNL